VTVYVFPNPLHEAIDYLETRLAEYPAGTTVSDEFPSRLTHDHLQVAWDGTPSEEQRIETAAVRVTYWTAPGRRAAAAAGASLARKHMLEFGSETVWRTRPGAGRTPGVDPDNDLPFCTFTVNVDLRPLS